MLWIGQSVCFLIHIIIVLVLSIILYNHRIWIILWMRVGAYRTLFHDSSKKYLIYNYTTWYIP